MPITQADVLNVLRNPVIQNIDFSVSQGIFVNAYQYSKVADYIASGGITVVSGDQTLAEYDDKSDTLRTQKGEMAPEIVEASALLLHECTHAIIDIDRVQVRRLVGEAVSYLAQFAYILLLDPSRPMPPVGRGMDPDDKLEYECRKLVTSHHLGEPAGFKKQLPDSDIDNFADEIFDHPVYAARIKSKTEMADPDGVSLTDDQDEAFQKLRRSRLEKDPLWPVVAHNLYSLFGS